jgi:hypothetical protein
MALCAASIYDESRAAKDVLYAVPAHNYQVEVGQFQLRQSERCSTKIVRVFWTLVRQPQEFF